MATGIFSTVRVAGEGVALAVVGAVLSMLIADKLAAAGLHGNVAAAAQSLAGGDFRGARDLLPSTDEATLRALYAQSFAWLLDLLAGITVMTAVVVFAFLRGGEASSDDAAAQPTDKSPKQRALSRGSP